MIITSQTKPWAKCEGKLLNWQLPGVCLSLLCLLEAACPMRAVIQCVSMDGGMHSHMCVHEQGGQGTTLGIILQDASYLVFL